MNRNTIEFEMWLQGMEESKAVVDEAQGLGIDTRTPDQIEEMKQKWGKEC